MAVRIAGCLLDVHSFQKELLSTNINDESNMDSLRPILQLTAVRSDSQEAP